MSDKPKQETEPVAAVAADEGQPEPPPSAEPAPFTRAWFDGVIGANQQLAQQKYAEWQQLQGAVALLIQQRALVAAE